MKKYIKKFLFTREENKFWDAKLIEGHRSKDLESEILILGAFKECKTFKHFKTNIEPKRYSDYLDDPLTYEDRINKMIHFLKKGKKQNYSSLHYFLDVYTYYPNFKKVNLSGPLVSIMQRKEFI